MSCLNCELCEGPGGRVVWESDAWRLVAVADDDFPAFYRVVSRRHVREFSDLSAAERDRCMRLVATAEQVLRDALVPAKVNLASLGNQTPHLHWHVIARFEWDSRFPDPIWAAARRAVDPPARQRLASALEGLDGRLARALTHAEPPTLAEST